MKKKHLRLVDFNNNVKDSHNTDNWVYTVPKTGLYLITNNYCKDGSHFHLINEKSQTCENCDLDISSWSELKSRPSLWSRIVAWFRRLR